MVTLKQVAQEAGVSMSTASAALRELDIVRPDTSKKVHTAAKKLNYHINMSARALRSGHSDIFTMIIPDLENQYYAKLANSLSNELLSNNKRLIIQVSQFDKAKELEQIKYLNPSVCDGLFICSTHNTGKEVHAAAGNYPVVMFDDMSDTDQAYYDAIETPSQSGMYAAIQHLHIERGKKHIGIVGTLEGQQPANALSYALRHNRYDFAHQALLQYGLNYADVFIPSEWSVDAGVQTAHRLFEQGMPYDALCCMNDELALGVLRGLSECGVNVPEIVAVTGFDGIVSGSYTMPTLTTVAVDFKGMAQTAVDLMQQKTEQQQNVGADPMPRRIIVGFQMLKRESTMGKA